MRQVVYKPSQLQIKLPVTSEYQALFVPREEDFYYLHIYNAVGVCVVFAISYFLKTYLISTKISTEHIPCGVYKAYFALPEMFPENGIDLEIRQGVEACQDPQSLTR